MTQDQKPEPRRRLNPNLLFLFFLLLLLCLCAAAPTLAKSFDPLQPVADFTEPIVCRVPQLAAVALFCPEGERGAYCGQPCDPDVANACGPFEDVSCVGDPTGKFACGGPGCAPTTTDGGGCFVPCKPDDPNACAEGLKCVQATTFAAAAVFSCQGDVCQPPPDDGGGCWQVCDPNDEASCAEGLKCGMYGSPTAGLYACVSEQCPTPPGNGAGCFQKCDPADDNACAPGLECAMYGSPTAGIYACVGTLCGGQTDGGGEQRRCECKDASFVCYDASGNVLSETPNHPQCVPTSQGACDCEGTDYVCRDAAGQITSASYNTSRCGGGDTCECREPDKTYVCPDGTFAPFNPNCGVGGDTGGGCTCIPNPACQTTTVGCQSYYICQETGQPCSPGPIP